jgi:porin
MKTSSHVLRISSCLGLVAFLFAPRATCADDTTQPATSPSYQLSLEPRFPPESIDQKLLDAAARPAGLLPYGPVSVVDPLWKQLNQSLDRVGLRLGLAYTIVFQAATSGPGNRDASGGDFDLFGDWRLLGAKDSPYAGFLYFAAEYRHALGTQIPPASLGGQIGSLWGTTNGFGNQVFTVKELYWEQRFDTDRAILRVGKLDPENYYNSNYWQSDNKFFLNQAFSSFPVRAFPGQGLGVNVTAKITDAWYISTGVQDAEGQKTRVGFDTFFGDFNLFSAFEVRFTPTLGDLGSGNYRLTAWYRDAGETNGKPHDAGIDLSIDQHIGPHFVPFFRYGAGEGNINGIEQMISTGVGWEGKLLTESDVIGFGAAWGQPTNHTLRDQYAAEVFYRMQVSPDNQLTIGYQAIVDPANAPSDHVVGVFELRWRVSF